MNKVDILCGNDREIMTDFSRLCLGCLNENGPLKLLLSVFQHFLDANVLKEIDKDRLIIEQAAAEFEEGNDRADIDVDELFEKTKKIDDEFVKKLSNPLLSLNVRYEDFGEIRKKRIAIIAGMVFDLLHNWKDGLTFPDIVKSAFAEENYRGILNDILHLYNVETRMLSNSITFRGPIGKAKDFFADRLYEVMERTAGDIASTYATKVYATKVDR